MEKFSEEKIQQIQHELESQMDKEDDFLKEVEHLSLSIAHRLIKETHTHEHFMGVDYIFNLNCDKANKIVTVMCTDPVKFAIGNGHYRPCIARGMWDDRYNYEENVYVVVKGILCNKAGIVNVEEINNSDDN